MLALIVFSSRCFILLGGSDYWIYGYLVIYIWLECIIALGIVQRRLPYSHEMNINDVDNPLVLKKTKYVDLAKIPEFIFVLITISLVVTIVIATAFEPKGVYLADLNVGDGISYTTACGLAILFVFSFLFIWCWIRSFKRKLDNTVSNTYMYFCSKKVDQYLIFSLVVYCIAIFWSLGLYPLMDSKNVLVSGFMVPAIIFFFLNVVIVYIKNGYFFVEDIPGINRNNLAHNKRVDSLKIKAKELHKKIREEGPEAVYGDENGRLVQKVMDMEVARRQAIKLAKELNGEEEVEDEKVSRAGTGHFGRSIHGRSPKKSDTNKINPAAADTPVD